MTPLVLFVGFLGAGKTTLLRKLVPLLRDKGIIPSIILNDYQNARIDAALFHELNAAVTPISGSCVCCGSRQELLDALDNYSHPPNGALLLETNGTTDAEELVTALSADPNLRRFSLPYQVSVVDAKRWQRRFWHNGLEAGQIHTASAIVLGHADSVDSARLKKVISSLEKLGVPLPAVSPEELAAEISNLVDTFAEVDEREPRCTAACCNNHTHDDLHPSGHMSGHLKKSDHAEHHFAAIELQLPHVVNQKTFEAALNDLPQEILRAKGIVRFAEEPDAVHIFQKIAKFDSAQIARLEGTPVSDQPVAVFVGRRIAQEFPNEFLAAIRLD